MWKKEVNLYYEMFSFLGLLLYTRHMYWMTGMMYTLQVSIITLFQIFNHAQNMNLKCKSFFRGVHQGPTQLPSKQQL